MRQVQRKALFKREELETQKQRCDRLALSFAEDAQELNKLLEADEHPFTFVPSGDDTYDLVTGKIDEPVLRSMELAAGSAHNKSMLSGLSHRFEQRHTITTKKDAVFFGYQDIRFNDRKACTKTGFCVCDGGRPGNWLYDKRLYAMLGQRIVSSVKQEHQKAVDNGVVFIRFYGICLQQFHILIMDGKVLLVVATIPRAVS